MLKIRPNLHRAANNVAVATRQAPLSLGAYQQQHEPLILTPDHGGDGLGLGYARGQFSEFGAPASVREASGTYSTARPYDGVEKTIEDMRRMVKESLLREQMLPMRRLAEEIVSQVKPKDYLSELAAIYYWVLVHQVYRRDPAHQELVTHALASLVPQPWDRAAGRRARAEDCESVAISICSLAMTLGSQCDLVTVSTQPTGGFHHVFVRVKMPSGDHVVVDTVPAFNTNQMLKAIRQHQVWPVEPVRLPGNLAKWGVAGENLSGYEPIEQRGARHAGLGLSGWDVSTVPSTEGIGFPFEVLSLSP